MKKNNKKIERLVNIGISKITHLNLLELQNKLYKSCGKKLSLNFIIAKLIEFYADKYGIR